MKPGKGVKANTPSERWGTVGEGVVVVGVVAGGAVGATGQIVVDVVGSCRGTAVIGGGSRWSVPAPRDVRATYTAPARIGRVTAATPASSARRRGSDRRPG